MKQPKKNLIGRRGSGAKKAKIEMRPNQKSGGQSSIEVQSAHFVTQSDSGQVDGDPQIEDAAVATHSDACAKIIALHRQARFALKSQSRVDRSLEAFIRVNVFNFNPHGETKEIERISKATLDLLKAIRRGETPDEYAALVPIINASDISSQPWADIRANCEKQMQKLAATTPGFALVTETKGFGALGLAQIIGETGDLSKYATVSKLWKRMGYAPMNGYAASSWRTNRADGSKLSSDEWVALGYSPERYSIAYSLADSMFRHQIKSAAKSETTFGEPQGPYGA
jgi:hypothetical protein